ncbi:MAG: hypothetical protein FK733_19225 [Asgard group archaeon]|nr:hypothetical protein [Asgard group archaeon]
MKIGIKHVVFSIAFGILLTFAILATWVGIDMVTSDFWFSLGIMFLIIAGMLYIVVITFFGIFINEIIKHRTK